MSRIQWSQCHQRRTRRDQPTPPYQAIGFFLDEIFPGVNVKRFYENVASMDDEEARWLTDDINEMLFDNDLDFCHLVKMDNANLVPNSRPRYFWLDVDLEDEGEDVNVYNHCKPLKEHTLEYKEVTLYLNHPPVETWLDPGTSWNHEDPEAKLPTFVRAIPRKRPVFKPAGIMKCDAETLERYEADSYRYPP